MRILITGANGFIGKNLASHLRYQEEHTLYLCDIDTTEEQLASYCRDCEFVFHLAGINRPQDPQEFMVGNRDFTKHLTDLLLEAKNPVPVVLASSTQAALDNPYGESKRMAESCVRAYGEAAHAPVYIYRFSNVFGKWCRPNYNSVVATFCHNIAHGLPIQINDPSTQLTLTYIDDLLTELLCALAGAPHTESVFCKVPTTYQKTLGEIAELITGFAETRAKNAVPATNDPFTVALYATYLSYLPTDAFAYPLTKHEDVRGSFTEIFRTPERGQVSVNVAHPGITKGNHWHHTKNEKFIVVSGEASIRFRKVGQTEVYEYIVTGEKPEVVDIPTGYTHAITNIGQTDLVTIMWASECFDPAHPDTYFEEV